MCHEFLCTRFRSRLLFQTCVGPVAPLPPLSAPFLRRVLVLGYRERARRATPFVSVPVVVLASCCGRVLLSFTTRAGTWNQWRITSTGAKGLHFVVRAGTFPARLSQCRWRSLPVFLLVCPPIRLCLRVCCKVPCGFYVEVKSTAFSTRPVSPPVHLSYACLVVEDRRACWFRSGFQHDSYLQ